MAQTNGLYSLRQVLLIVAAIGLIMTSYFDGAFAGGYGGGGGGGVYGGSSASASASASASSFSSGGAGGGGSGNFGSNPFLSGAGSKGAGFHNSGASNGGLSFSLHKDVNLNGLKDGITGLVGGLLGGVSKLHGSEHFGGASGGAGSGVSTFTAASNFGSNGFGDRPSGGCGRPACAGGDGQPTIENNRPFQVPQPDLSYVPPPKSNRDRDINAQWQTPVNHGGSSAGGTGNVGSWSPSSNNDCSGPGCFQNQPSTGICSSGRCSDTSSDLYEQHGHAQPQTFTPNRGCQGGPCGGNNGGAFLLNGPGTYPKKTADVDSGASVISILPLQSVNIKKEILVPSSIGFGGQGANGGFGGSGGCTHGGCGNPRPQHGGNIGFSGSFSGQGNQNLDGPSRCTSGTCSQVNEPIQGQYGSGVNFGESKNNNSPGYSDGEGIFPNSNCATGKCGNDKSHLSYDGPFASSGAHSSASSSSFASASDLNFGRPNFGNAGGSGCVTGKCGELGAHAPFGAGSTAFSGAFASASASASASAKSAGGYGRR